MTKKRLPVLLCLLFPAFTTLYSQDEWIEYSSTDRVNAIAEEGDTLWLATPYGLVNFNRKTYESRQYTLLNTGLPGIGINDIAVDNNGAKWISTTYNGLVRFDGEEWTVYDTATSPPIPQYTRKLCVGPDNTVWVSTYDELASLRGNTVQLYAHEQYPCLQNTSSIHVDEHGVLWLGKDRHPGSCITAYRLLDGELQPVHDSLSSRFIHDITSRNGTTWFATSKAEPASPSGYQYPGTLVAYNGADIRMYSWQAAGFSKAVAFTGVSADSAGGVWVITSSTETGVARFDGSTWTLYQGADFPFTSPQNLETIITDSDGVVWMGTQGSGLLRFNGDTWEKMPPLGLGIPRISRIAVDKDQSIWASHSWGINDNHVFCTRFNGSDIRTIAAPEGGRAIFIDGNGTKWIITKKADLFRLAGNDWKKEGSLIRDILHIDRSNHLWALTSDRTISRFDGSTWTDISGTAPDEFGYCSAITQDRNGTMWFGTSSGLWTYNSVWKHYPRSRIELPDMAVGALVMACDSSNAIWIGSRGRDFATNGLYRFDGVRWKHFSYAEHPISYISWIVTDRTGNVWAGGNLLHKFDGTNWTHYDNTNSPVSSAPYYLLIDTTNTLWMFNEAGILGYRPGGIVASAGEAPSDSQGGMSLFSYPNPASSLTTISYSVPAGSAQRVSLKVYNALGNEIGTAVNRIQQPGNYSVEFDTGALPPGVYYYQLQTGNITTSRQMVVVR